MVFSESPPPLTRMDVTLFFDGVCAEIVKVYGIEKYVRDIGPGRDVRERGGA